MAGITAGFVGLFVALFAWSISGIFLCGLLAGFLAATVTVVLLGV